MNPVVPHTGHDRRSLRERVERRIYRRYKSIRHYLGTGLPRTHVFVAGMQRSGTNMLMETLEWNLHTDVYHETDERAFENYEMRPVSVIQDLAQRSQAPFFIIKALCELDRIRNFLDTFTPAKAIWIVRHYHDSTNSAIRSFRNFAPQVMRLAKNRDSDGWRGRGMSDHTQALLQAIARADMDEASAAALTWYYRNVLFFEQSLDQDARACLLHYEDLVRDPAGKITALCDFLGLPGCGPWMTRYIHAHSVRKTQPPTLMPEVEQACAMLMDRFTQLPRL